MTDQYPGIEGSSRSVAAPPPELRELKRAEFRGTLLQPLNQQRDRDGDRIDPAGVTFDPTEDVPIWRNFNYTVPDDLLGHGRVSRETDGSLVVEGELYGSAFGEAPKLAIGVTVDSHVKGEPISASKLMSVALTAEHVDPTQPSIAIIRRVTMNLVRLGHYFNPGNDSCQTALVVKVVEEGSGINSVVNLTVWDSDGDQEKRLNVPENTGPTTGDGNASFHLSTNCPWRR